jgi:hypothetical protein
VVYDQDRSGDDPRGRQLEPQQLLEYLLVGPQTRATLRFEAHCGGDFRRFEIESDRKSRLMFWVTSRAASSDH